MLDYAFDTGHRARLIENGEVSNMKEILIKVYGLIKKHFLTLAVHFLTDAPATAHEGSRGSWAYGLRRALRAVLQESPTVGFCVAVQASAADACPHSSDSSD